MSDDGEEGELAIAKGCGIWAMLILAAIIFWGAFVFWFVAIRPGH